MSNKSDKLGVGLDVGTMNFVSARKSGPGVENKYKVVRDAYIELDLENIKTLKMSNISFEEIDGQIVVMGDSSFQMANLFKQEVKRPLSRGIVSPGAIKAQMILNNLVWSVLDRSLEDGEHCYYSVPAEPIDLPDQDVVYHADVFRKILVQHGYTAHPMNEAMAIIYSECHPIFSGLALSFGAGLCNVAMAHHTIMGLSFSIARGGGDWIDTHAAKATGSTISRMCAVKERGGFDLMKPSKDNSEQEAISLYVRTLIHYCIDKIAEKLRKEHNDLDILDEIPIVLSGGTTLAKGFLELFQEEFESVKVKKGFPIQVSEIRLAKDPLRAVADGLLVLARNEYESD